VSPRYLPSRSCLADLATGLAGDLLWRCDPYLGWPLARGRMLVDETAARVCVQCAYVERGIAERQHVKRARSWTPWPLCREIAALELATDLGDLAVVHFGRHAAEAEGALAPLQFCIEGILAGVGVVTHVL
jgi:hypothetical protein